jgi:hypothetical protein
MEPDFEAVLIAALILLYVPQRQIFPFMVASISSSEGLGFEFNKADAVII